MINLIPSSTYNLEQLWFTIKSRNKWFVKLRFIAGTSSLLLAVALKFIPGLGLTDNQFIALILVSLSILVYNLLFKYISETELVKESPEKFNHLHISLLQIIFDLSSLLMITYLTGNVESPFIVFFIFHMIIGSMILPGWIVYTICTIVNIIFIASNILEYFSVIPHFDIQGFIHPGTHSELGFLFLTIISLVIMLYLGIYFADSLATGLYKREQELRIALDNLSEAEKIKQKYTMGIVHEIKSPIVAVQSYIDLVLGKYAGPISEPVESKLKRARARTEEAVQIINDVLNISKLKLLNKISKSPVNIKELLNKIVNQKSSTAESKKIELKLIEETPDNDVINADFSLLELAFSNLIGNALKYTNKGGKVEIAINKKEKDRLTITISDNGIGIPEKDRARIFTDFFRASNAKSKGFEGTGMGLNIVKQIIEQHNGEIYFESPSKIGDEDNPGTTFKITLPV